jgi:hypothetical protein
MYPSIDPALHLLQVAVTASRHSWMECGCAQRRLSSCSVVCSLSGNNLLNCRAGPIDHGTHLALFPSANSEEFALT